MTELALLGGQRTWNGDWPIWPQPGPKAEGALERVLHGGRWAVSGTHTGRAPVEIELGELFARFTGASWCLPVDHGSSAILAALIGLGVKSGDEVIVPGLTWVACASTVARAGAVPVLVDVDPDTLCIDPRAVEAAISPATVAILAVHLYSAMADMDALRVIADRYRLLLIEDAAQAYGAMWNGKKAGSLGIAGTFSTQQGKTLTSGEGGLLITSDEILRDRVEMLRGDGRRYTAGPRTVGQPDLEDHTEVQGWNMHLSEFQAALLLDGLEVLDEQNRARSRAAEFLDRELAADGDLESIRPYAANDVRAYYHYVIRLQDGGFSGCSAERVCEALSAELGYWIHPPYRPLDVHPLYDPRRLPGRSLAAAYDPGRFHLPVAHREAGRSILLHHPMLLAEPDHLAAIVEAFAKVRRLSARLR